MRRVYRKRRSFGFITPFLVLIGLGIIIALGFQVWQNLQGKDGDVKFYVASGRAKILFYGESQWEDAYSGTSGAPLVIGDSIKTSPEGRLVLKFFNGTLVRLGENSQITLIDVNERGTSEKIVFALDKGKVWVNKMKTETANESVLEVQTSHMVVHDQGTIFEVEKSTVESVKVMEGSVSVDILLDDEDKTEIVDTEDVELGQQLELTEAILKDYRNHKEPTVILAQRPEFRNSDWYAWNIQEDESPTDFSKGSSIASNSSSSTTTNAEGAQNNPENSANNPDTTGSEDATNHPDSTDNADNSDDVDSGNELTAPKITNPTSDSLTTKESKVAISGTVSDKTAKIVVKQVVGGKSEEYTLTRFKSGDKTFAYNVSEVLGNFKAGENVYKFYALDKGGNESDPATLTITYDKPKPVITEALTAPKVISFNGSSASEVSTDIVKVVGEIHGAEKVIVNGYTLSQYQPGATSWVYYANVKNGNLKAGVNEYKVYGVDPQGNKTEAVTFTITYTPADQTSTSSTGTQTTETQSTETQSGGSSSTSTSVPESSL